MKKTMTILGDAEILFAEGIENLMKQDLRLLFVSEDEVRNSKLKARLEQTEAVAEVEFTSCERDGCWEADIIVITQPEMTSDALLERIKEVATQKVVVACYKAGEQLERMNLQQVLPHSGIVEIVVDSQVKELSVSGNDPEAKEVLEIFTGAGFKMQQQNS